MNVKGKRARAEESLGSVQWQTGRPELITRALRESYKLRLMACVPARPASSAAASGRRPLAGATAAAAAAVAAAPLPLLLLLLLLLLLMVAARA